MNLHRSWVDLFLKNRFAHKQFDLDSCSPYKLLRKMHAAATKKLSACFHRIIPRTARVGYYNATESFHRCKNRRRDFAAAGIVQGGMTSPGRTGRKIIGFFACGTAYRGTPLADFLKG